MDIFVSRNCLSNEELQAKQGSQDFPVMDSQENDTTTDELTTQVKDISNQLRESEVEASSVIMQWQESCAGLEAQLEILKKENEDLLTTQVEKIASQLQESDAEGVETLSFIPQLQGSYTGLEEQEESLTKENEDLHEKQNVHDVPLMDSQESDKHDDYRIENPR
jgi:hypothetical protein